MALKKYYIKKRYRPYGQGVYYVAKGLMSKTAAKKIENSNIGTNYMYGYDTAEEYKRAIVKLKSEGKQFI